MAKGGYFSNEFFGFLSELERNNNREWFQANKARFEEDVQAPSVRFVAEAGAKLRAISLHLVADAKPFGGSISRIYRDTRFSKDKRPYHTHVGIHFSHEGMKGGSEHLPGYFVHLEPKESGVYSGVWRPEGASLAAIRGAIVKRSADWKKATRAPVSLWGESLKRPPPGVAPDHPMVEDLKRKDFIGAIEVTRQQVTGPKFMDDFVAACKKRAPLNAFLAKAMKVDW
jgi:uncharacterized protein (TIGR02453 family)